MENKATKTNRRPIMTIISLALTIIGNLLAFSTAVWFIIVGKGDGLFDLVPLVIAAYLLPAIDIIGFLIVLVATWRKESRIHLRRTAYIISLISYPIFFLVVRIFL